MNVDFWKIHFICISCKQLAKNESLIYVFDNNRKNKKADDLISQLILQSMEGFLAWYARSSLIRGYLTVLYFFKDSNVNEAIKFAYNSNNLYGSKDQKMCEKHEGCFKPLSLIFSSVVFSRSTNMTSHIKLGLIPFSHVTNFHNKDLLNERVDPPQSSGVI